MYGGKSGKVFGMYCGKLEESQETTVYKLPGKGRVTYRMVSRQYSQTNYKSIARCQNISVSLGILTL